jgi:hypothetical protein
MENVNPVVVLAANEPANIQKTLEFNMRIHQKGLKYKNKDGEIVLADPYGNDSYGNVKVTVVCKDDKPINIAKIAGAAAREAYMWAKNLSKNSGIVRKAGFIIDIEQTLVENGESHLVTTCATSRVVLSCPSDAASFIAQSLLGANDGENDEAYLTGNFTVSPEGKLLMNRMGYGDAAAALPFKEKTELMDIKRKQIKKQINETKKAQLAQLGLLPKAKQVVEQVV